MHRVVVFAIVTLLLFLFVVVVGSAVACFFSIRFSSSIMGMRNGYAMSMTVHLALLVVY
jgi:hypothetical protein